MEQSKTLDVPGHEGPAGGTIARSLQAAGYPDILTRSHEELDLADQDLTGRFFHMHRREVVPNAARAGGIHEAVRGGTKCFISSDSACIFPRPALHPLTEEYLPTGPVEKKNRAYAVAKIAGIETCRSLTREYGGECLSLIRKF